ncbi:molybdate ABC transporter permease subunit [Microbulbifer yueqingensis]|uniref:Molybdenum transport system permease n=1 Tax=Microbulbifer yueqingensis TaxID=658219 RepID=A0A1G8XH08_9GAMM|nr:molybdate ABC transporter permease subunit [Microbulbifer yueqingensis]SDJ89919.1 molybdate transport system permease protein [Microbulbifer yueqingensis]
MTIDAADIGALWLTLRLAAITTLLLLLIGVPLAWKLSHWQSRWRHAVEVIITLPLVLPPTVLGFYLLLAFSPNYAPGRWLAESFGQPLVFSFTGLVIASVIYSLPFMVQPLLASFSQNGRRLTSAAAALGMPPLAALLRVLLPASRPAIISACALSFAHTLGEFGVVLMIGGAIPGETQVVSIALYQHVEAMEYGAAHRLALVLVAVTTALLLLARWLGRAATAKERDIPVLGVPG